MSIDKAFFIGFSFLFSMLIGMQIYFAYRIRKHRQEAPNTPEPRMSPKATFRFGFFHIVFQSYIIIGSLYYMWVGKNSALLGIGIIFVALMLLRRPIQLVRDHRPVHADLSMALPLLPRRTNTVTPELIMETLGEKCVMDAIKKDLQKTHQICGREQWRLGLLAPDSTQMMNMADHILVKRTAIVHATSYFNSQFNNVMILHGTREPMVRSYPGWSYRLRRQIPAQEYGNIRDLEISTDSLSARDRNPVFFKFLQEDGFPLKDRYVDGDPLTTERGGTIVIDKGQIKIIYPNYFVQSRLIDDEGNLVYMGLDENFQLSSTWCGISAKPSVSARLYKCVQYNDYAPIVRYRSFPYASDFMLPILDTPLSDSGWADLFIDPRGKAKLFIAKQKTLEQWYEMMERLRQLFFGELAKKGYCLFGLTKDRMHLNEYFFKKQKILEDYFIVIDWSLG